jgi:rhodanese-related sulfurtransferase
MSELTIEGLLAAARARIVRVSPAEAMAATAAGALIVDTRCAEARSATGVIPGSIHIPLSVLYWRLDQGAGHEITLSDRTRQTILVCADGYSSSLAAATLRDLGFVGATDLDGGFNGWVGAGFPVEAVS